jgi:DnaJ-class molecular chaperone
MSSENIESTAGKYELFEAPCPICGGASFTILLKSGITNRLVCPNCNTPSYVHVKKDLGIIVLRQDEYKKAICKECGGTGKCKTCKGTGEMLCPECNGKGWFFKRDYKSCGRCGGDGKIKVDDHGFFNDVKKGNIVLGSGLVRCTSCIGTGVCSRCGGEGLILEDL